ncbi:ThuA domain-containing protein [Zhongshania sp.]|uniref:ThuA domain-containing protein n=1 Tax=Zhongshania sp. TaxID=1971902 RepID=UPI0035637F8E
MKIFKIFLVVVLLLLAAAFAYLNYTGILRSPEYDSQAPEITGIQRPAVLVLNKTNGFIHRESQPAASRMLIELAAENGWHIYQTENAASHNAEDLAKFDLVVWNNTSGDLLTIRQRVDFKSWLLAGGKWLGLHSAGGDIAYEWSWFPETLIGAQFTGHTLGPQLQDAQVLVVEPSPLTAHINNPWLVPKEEWYAFDRNPRDTGSTILLALDESSYKPVSMFGDASMPGEHPIVWTHKLGEGRIVYSAMGHTAATYDLPEYRQFISKVINMLVE